jgi:hypothetical protein
MIEIGNTLHNITVVLFSRKEGSDRFVGELVAVMVVNSTLKVLV